MTTTIPTSEPASIIAGNTVKWTKSLPDYLPADGWVLTYALVISGNQKIITATDNGDGTHLATIAAADSANYTADIYHWQAYVTKGTDRYPAGTGRVEVKPKFATQTSGHDARSHVKKVLEALEATILGKASEDQLSLTVNGRTLQQMLPGDLIKWKNHYEILYKQELQKEASTNGNGIASKGQVRF